MLHLVLCLSFCFEYSFYVIDSGDFFYYSCFMVSEILFHCYPGESMGFLQN